jgi:small subunit ribosomal protein S21
MAWAATRCFAAVPCPRRGSTRKGRAQLRIEVLDNQIEPALKALKKAMATDGLFKEMKRRAFYEKPSVKRKRKRAEARRKRRKAERRAQRRDD